MVGIISRAPVPAAYELLAAPHSLIWLSRNGRRWRSPDGRGPHDDGWGLAWHENGGMRVEKRGQPANTDPDFIRIADGVTTNILIGHVRKASPGMTICDANAHPFCKDDLVLAHNGDVDLPPDPGGADIIDSQRFLHWIADNWDRTESGLLATLQDAMGFRHTSLSFLMSDGHQLYALRQTKLRTEYLDYYSLYVKHTRDKTTIASEPLDDSSGWIPVDNGTLLILGAGKQKRLTL
ncbi:MAG: class II glutamine amidotransferase [Dehalococcoidia bacterium]|nr:class II glutamine amidotransferase [Dehalococcoidia bacterium]